MMLTEIEIRRAKPSTKSYKKSDGQGLHLLVQPTGTKLWQFRYRHQGKEKTASFGPYPMTTLAEARAQRDAARKMVAKGIDPVQVKHARIEAERDSVERTFEVVARQWWDHWKTARSDRHADYVIRRLEQNVFPAFGSRPIDAISTPVLVAMAKTVAERGAHDIAARCLQMCGQVFRYAIAHGVTQRNPASEIKPSDILPVRAKTNYTRVEHSEFPVLLRKIEAYQGRPITRLAMKLMALTFVRTGELIGAQWREIDFDAAQWRIPAERMKMKTPHIVPLAKQALEILATLQLISGHREYVFPGERNPRGHMSDGAILGALKRMGYQGRMTGHGFRGVASTALHEMNWAHHHIELQLAHQERNRVSAAYNHATYLVDRKKMMQAWADHLDEIRGVESITSLHRVV